MTRHWFLLAAALVVAGCSDDVGALAPAPTATVTETVTATPDSSGLLLEEPDFEPGTPRPLLELTVFRDGCGVIRSEAPPGVDYRNLAWTFADADGFQVLQRNALGETRYRYFQGGTYTVTLEAFVDGAYRAVSNEVTVHC